MLGGKRSEFMFMEWLSPYSFNSLAVSGPAIIQHLNAVSFSVISVTPSIRLYHYGKLFMDLIIGQRRELVAVLV